MYYSKLGHISLLVEDYDEALVFFTDKLKFHLIEDTAIDEKKRWILVSPTTTSETSILLVKAETPEQVELVGRQGGNAVLLFLYVSDIKGLHKHIVARQIEVTYGPIKEEWGTIMKIKDLYGNLIEMIEPA